MDAKLQRRIQRYGWDRAVDDYDRHWGPLLRKPHDALVRAVRPRSSDRGVDVACGTGFVTLRLAAEVGPNGHIDGIDISDEMVKTTAQAALVAGLDNVTTARMDAEALEFNDNCFDFSICALGLMYAPSPEMALAEMRRVTKPGGSVAVAVWGARKACGWADLFPIVDAQVKSEVCPLFFRLGTGETLRHEMANAGLTEVRIDRIHDPLHVADDQAAIEAFLAGGAVALAYKRFDDATKRAVDDAFLTTLSAFRTASGYRIPAEFVVCSATVA